MGLFDRDTGWPEAWIPELEDDTALRGRVATELAEARRCWPKLAVDDQVFVAHLAGVARGDSLATVVEATRWGDLLVACAASIGQPAAIEAIEGAHLSELCRMACRRQDQIAAPELLQSMRVHLFVADPEGAPKIAQYRGRGSLRSWLRMTVGRHLQNLARKQAREISVDDRVLADSLIDGADDPDLAYMRRLYLEQYRQSFAVAAGRLEHQQRTLLRLTFVDRVSVDELGALFGVHRSTAARWVVGARDDLVAGLRRELSSALGVNASRLDSILALIESRVHVTLERVLATAES